MIQVHALPTEKATGFGHYASSLKRWMNNLTEGVHYHLYFTSNEEIKEGDWILDRLAVGFKCNDYYIATAAHESMSKTTDRWRKIVATTNKILNAHRREDDVSTYIGMIPQDFIEAFVREQGIWEVLLEKEGVVQSTTWEEDEPELYRYKLNSQGEVIWHPVKERTWTDAEVLTMLEEYGNHCRAAGKTETSRTYHQTWFYNKNPL